MKSKALNLIAPLLWTLVCIATPVVAAEVSAIDDAGNTVTLKRPAQRIAVLAPHAAELVAAAGLEDRLVATVLHTDYPPSVNALPRVGDAFNVNVESLLATQPDLIVFWRGGANWALLQKLRDLKLPVYESNPQKLSDIPKSIRALGLLGGTAAAAQRQAELFESTLSTIRNSYAKRSPVKVFYQLWDAPIMSINRGHVLSDVIRLCGGVNVFADALVLTPTMDKEAVLVAAPQVMIQSGGKTPKAQFSPGLEKTWGALKQIPAVRLDLLYNVDADSTARMGPRMAQGAQQICQAIEVARQKLALSPSPH